MGKRYESKKQRVSENRESAKQNAEKRDNLENEFASLGELSSMISNLDDETVAAITAVENSYEQKQSELTEEYEQIEEEKNEIADEINQEIDKLNSGSQTLDQLGRFEFGKSSIAKASSEYKRLIEDYRGLLDDLDEGTGGSRSSGGGGELSGMSSIISDSALESNDESSGDQVEASFAGVTFNSSTNSVEASNDNPQRDITNAFAFADANYDKSSIHWQENANREVERLNGELADVDNRISSLGQQRDQAYSQLSAYITENNLSPENAHLDNTYSVLNENYFRLDQDYSTLVSQRNALDAQRSSIEANIDPSMRTTFVGRNQLNFEESYNGIITDTQGQTVPGYGGTCGINHECSVVNQQTGSSLDESYGINYAVSHGLCETGGSYAENGGTSADDRRTFLMDHGVSFSRVTGGRGTGTELSLDDLATRFNRGESAGLMLKAEDLSQPGIDQDSRKWAIPVTGDNIRHNQARYKANHATTIAGFSYGADGKVTGLWINDTGGWAGSNRVFIDRNKFNDMQRNTEGFSVEFSRRI